MRVLCWSLLMLSITPTLSARRIVLCLDGTWNSPHDEAVRDDGTTVLKPTNTLKLCRAVLPQAKDGTQQLTYYDIGVGSLAEYPGLANRLLRFFDRNLGGPWGAGFEGNVEDALHFLNLNYEPGDDVFIFGFSRGAATARAITRFLEWSGGLPQKIDAYYLPVLFHDYVIARGDPGAFTTARDRINNELARSTPKPRDPLQPFNHVTVRYLGVWDTVLALGSRFKATGASTSVATKTFHAGITPAREVLHARQALAIDEARYDFRPEVWRSTNPENPAQRLEQQWFAGVHSNIGGGYLHDGLANIAFDWILDGAHDDGLETDLQYTKHYGKNLTAPLYSSSSLLYKIGDFLRGSVGKGKRSLLDWPETAHLSVDPLAIKRLRMNAADLEGPKVQPAVAYRPQNLLQFLACQPDLTAYLKSIGVDDIEQKPLPADVLQRIDALKPRCNH